MTTSIPLRILLFRFSGKLADSAVPVGQRDYYITKLRDMQEQNQKNFYSGQKSAAEGYIRGGEEDGGAKGLDKSGAL